jgi:dehydrogenase/reductase SDR family protein 4
MELTPQTLFDLSDKVALVTGASRGIGAAIAHTLALAGAKVGVSSRRLENVEPIAQAIRLAQRDALAIPAHVGHKDDLRKLVELMIARFGGIDILVNNAAANPAYGPLLEMDEGVFDKIFSVNVKGPLALCRLVQPIMARRGGGAILNISSVGGIRPEPGLGLYSVSKAALLSLTKVMAAEWSAYNIRVNALCPGLVKTTFSAALWQDEKTLQRFLQQVPLGRIAQPEEMVGLALCLVSPAGSYTTGAAFVNDGGYLL